MISTCCNILQGKKTLAFWRFFFLLVFYSIPAYANAIWPALELEFALLNCEIILFGLVVECVFVKRVFEVSYYKASLGTIVANLVSSLLGVVLVPLSGIVWELFPGSVLHFFFGFGTFNPITWFAALISACAINVLIEGLIYNHLFNFSFARKYWTISLLLVANAISVLAALGVLIVTMPDMI